MAFRLESFLLRCISLLNSHSHKLDYESAGPLPWVLMHSRDIYRRSFLIAWVEKSGLKPAHLQVIQ